MKKQFSISQKIPDTSLYLIGLIAVPILLLFLTKNIILTLTVSAGLIFWYLHTGKIKPYDGEIIFIFGLPRSGKTMLLAKIAHDNIKKRSICVNKELEHMEEKDAVIERADIGYYRFGTKEKSAILMFDEVSLDGFDNRNFKTNFQGSNGEQILKGFKKCGHRYTSIVLANQGWNEVDSKIREGLCHCAYWVKNKGAYSVAIKLRKSITIDNLTGTPRDEYIKPSIFERLIDPSCYVYLRHKKYGKYFDTEYDEGLPLWDYGAPVAAGAPCTTNTDENAQTDDLKKLESALSNIDKNIMPQLKLIEKKIKKGEKK